MTTKKEMVRINDAAQALLQSKIDPIEKIQDTLDANSNSISGSKKKMKTPAAVVQKCIQAVKSGDMEQIRFHSKHVEDFTSLKDREGMPLLHVAATVENVEIMDLLIVLGCDLNGKDERGGTAVLEAASVGNLRALKWLVKAGIEGGAARPDARGDTALHLASGKGRVHMMKWLLDQGCDLEAKTVDFKARPLQYAICHNEEESVRWLIKNGAEVRAQDNAYGWNALHIAAANGRSEICMLLIKHAPDLLTARSSDVTKLNLLPENIAFRNKHTLLSNRLKKLRAAYERDGANKRNIKAQQIAAEVAARRLLQTVDREATNNSTTEVKKKKKKKKKKKAIPTSIKEEEPVNSVVVEETEMPVPIPRVIEAEDHLFEFETVSTKRKIKKNKGKRDPPLKNAAKKGSSKGKKSTNAFSSSSSSSSSSSPSTEENVRLGADNGTTTIAVTSKIDVRGVSTATTTTKSIATSTNDHSNSNKKLQHVPKESVPAPIATQSPPSSPSSSPPSSPPSSPTLSPVTSPSRRSRRPKSFKNNPNLNPRAPSWSPTKREPWKAGSLGGKNRSQLLRKSWDKNSGSRGRGGGTGDDSNEADAMEDNSYRVQRFSAETTLEELNESTPENVKQDGESFANEFDRLLKR